MEAAVRTALDRDAILAGGDLRADVLRDLQRLRQPHADAGAGQGATGQPSAATSLDDRLQDGLPPALAKAWQSIPSTSAGSAGRTCSI